LGLGPKLYSLSIGSLQLSWRLLPLGSFVRLDVKELRTKTVPQQLLVHVAGVLINIVVAILAAGTPFGWINLLIAVGNLLPLYPHDGWKCGVVLMRAIMGRKSSPVEWTFTFSGGFISLVLINGVVRLFL
jgi:membrane-associated protease RseP (regulator of RpoE activity)